MSLWIVHSLYRYFVNYHFIFEIIIPFHHFFLSFSPSKFFHVPFLSLFKIHEKNWSALPKGYLGNYDKNKVITRNFVLGLSGLQRIWVMITMYFFFFVIRLVTVTYFISTQLFLTEIMIPSKNTNHTFWDLVSII